MELRTSEQDRRRDSPAFGPMLQALHGAFAFDSTNLPLVR